MSTVRIQLRRGTAADWTSVNPVLAAGEAGYESDTKKIKVGDGTSTWTALGYATITPAQLQAAIATGLGTDLTAYDVNHALGYTAADAADLSGLASQTSTDISDAITTAENYTDAAISTEVTNRNTAISSKSVDTLSQAEDFATTADTALHATITTEIATAKSQAITTSESYADTKKIEAISTAEGYTDTAISNLINGAPAALDTLREIADHFATDESTASALATTVSGKVAKAGDTMSGDLAMGGHKVKDLATPTLNTDAATKAYVDTNDQTTLTSANTYTDSAKASAISLAASNAAGIYATKSAPTFTGTITASESSLDGIVLKNGTVDGTKITSGTIHNLQIADVDGSKIAVASISGDRIISITEDQVTGLNTALGLKANLDSPTFSGTVVLPATTSIGTTTSTELGYVHGVTASIQPQLTTSSNHIAATTNVHGISDTSALATKTYADNAVSTEATNRATAVTNAITTSETYTDGKISTEVTNRNAAIATSLTTAEGYTDTAKAAAISTSEAYTDSAIATEVTNRNSAISTATANVVKTTDTGTVTSTMIADGTIVNADISSSAAIATSKISGLDTALAAKAPLASPTFTGTVSGITKSMVGLGNVDNTSDANKPVSTATQTALDAKLSLAGGTMTGTLTLAGAPTSDLHAATKLYVDGVASGINFHAATKVATTANLSTTYSNGTAGYGATLTADTNRAFSTVDGISGFSVGDRILVRAQTDAKQNGIYTLTTVGSSSAPWVLTRATDDDNNPNGEMAGGDFNFVTSGTLYGSTGFILSNTGTVAIGTDNINYVQFNAAQAILAGTGLSKNGTTLSIDTATTVDLNTAQTLTNKTITGTFTGPLTGNTAGTHTGAVVGNADTATKLATARNINGVAFDGSAAITVKASTTNALTIGTGLSGSSFDGSGAVTIAIDSTVATLTGSQTLTNKTLTAPVITLPSAGITFSDGSIQTVAAVPSITTIATAVAASNGTYYPSQYRDQMVPIAGAYTLTIAPDGTNTAPIGTSVDFYQSSGTGAAFAAGAGVTILSTPGLKLRTTGSVATIMKTAANTWLLFGDLSA